MGSTNTNAARRGRAAIVLTSLIALSALSLVAAIAWGSTGLRAEAFFAYLFGGVSSSADVILFKIRLPRALLSYLVGGGLSVAGCCLQGIFKNPMADSHILGVSAGAGFGAALGIACGVGSTLQAAALGLGSTAICALVGGILAVLCVMQVARVGSRTSASALLLAGIAVSSLFSALTSGVMILHRESMEQVVLWTLGSFSASTFEKVGFAAIVILPCSMLCMPFARSLNIMLLGEEDARMLGVDTARVTQILIALTTILAAACVSVSGIVGFVGLMLPHILRLVTGPDHRLLLPASFLGGGVFLCLADMLSRSLFPPIEVPVGVLSALFGVPFFLYLLRRQGKGGRA